RPVRLGRRQRDRRGVVHRRAVPAEHGAGEVESVFQSAGASTTMIRRILLMLCVAAPAAAHDFWLEPSTFRPVAGQTFTVSLLVGQDFAGDVIPRSAQLIESFTIRDAAGEHPVNGFENQAPAGYVRLDRPGCAEIGYRSKANPLELSAEKFNEFVRQEGLSVPPARGPH